MFRTTMLATATAAILAALCLTACSVPETTTPRPAPAAPAAAADTGKQAHTRQTFAVTWAGISEPERTALCDSLLLLGPDRAADEMGAGADHSTELDWDLMVDLLTPECATR